VIKNSKIVQKFEEELIKKQFFSLTYIIICYKKNSRYAKYFTRREIFHNMKRNTSLVTEICRMYYLDNLSQDKISSDLRISKSAVSRLLKEGREKGIVTFHIKDYEDRLGSLEDKLEQYFKLKEAVVVSDEGINSEEAIKKKVAKAAALYFYKEEFGKTILLRFHGELL